MFEDVDFAYRDDQQILHDISFYAEPGQRVALIGPTGSGKSTVTNLIPRFYDASDGRILVDGIDVRDLTAGQPAPAHWHCAARPVLV